MYLGTKLPWSIWLVAQAAKKRRSRKPSIVFTRNIFLTDLCWSSLFVQISLQWVLDQQWWNYLITVILFTGIKNKKNCTGFFSFFTPTSAHNTIICPPWFKWNKACKRVVDNLDWTAFYLSLAAVSTPFLCWRLLCLFCQIGFIGDLFIHSMLNEEGKCPRGRSKGHWIVSP